MGGYHLIGIKGAGMSSLALLLNDNGITVKGSDVEEYFFTEDNLRTRNIPILPFNEENIKPTDIIIVGNAFKNHPEYQKAKDLGCEVYTYHEFVGKLSKSLNTIAISGSHGKTTTTTMIKQILESVMPINYIIGDGQGGGSINSKYLVLEADEYERHFLAYYPQIAVVNNIDFDHPDYYKDIMDVKDAFQQFMNQATIIVYNGDDKLLKEAIPNDKKTISYGIDKSNDYYANNISNDKRYTYYDLYIKGVFNGKIKIPMFGMHSVYNSLAAIAATHLLVDDLNQIKNMLSNFKSGKRRFEEFIFNKQIIISDYAHHPKEIMSTIEAVNAKYPFKKVLVYFQPHTYTRTISFLNDFASALSLADKVYLREIFSSAREHHKTISANDLAILINDCEVINDDTYLDVFSQKINYIIIFMGAGDIDRYCSRYIEFIKNNNNFMQIS